MTIITILDIASIGVFLLLVFIGYKHNKVAPAMCFLLLGILIGGLTPFILLFPRGQYNQNPYASWILESFVLSIIGGIATLFTYGFLNRKRR